MMRNLLLLSFVMVLYSHPSLAQDGGAQTVIIDGKEYSKDEIIEDFLKVAFSDVPWNADAGEEDRKKIQEMYFPPKKSFMEKTKGLFSSEKKTIRKPTGPIWLREQHMHYVGKGPLYKRNVINKWNMPEITVGINWPPYFSPKPAKGVQKLLNPFAEVYYDDFVKLVRSQITEMSDAIGRPIKFIEPGDMIDTTSEYAQIRIVPLDGVGGRSWFIGNAPYASRYVDPAQYETKFMNGVLFQSHKRAYFDGYLLPDEALNLDLSICKVQPTIEKNVLKAMVNECLVRSLGLPAMSEHPKSLLSHWYTIPDEDFYTSIKWINPLQINGEPVHPRFEHISPEWFEDNAVGLNPNMTWFVLDEKKVNSFSKIPSYDKYMLSLLYCPQIKSGMTRDQARDVLLSNQSCFR